MKQFLALFSFLVLISCSKEDDNTVYSFDGVPIKYAVYGSGDVTLVFVHGWSGNKTNWDNQIEYFSSNYKAISIDIAGFGESGNARQNWSMNSFGKDVVAVLNDMDINNAVLIGFSMGGPIILEAAKLYHENIIGLVPVDVFHDVEFRMSNEQIESLVTDYMNYVKKPVYSEVEKIFSKNTDSSLVKRFINNWSHTNFIGWEESLRSVFRYMYLNDDIAESLSQINIPVVCINTDRFEINLESAGKFTPDFDVKVIKGSGHVVNWERPNEFNRLLNDCINQFIDGN